ncbi:hypothetical protein INR49_016307 [Caranx melampygus]|nr:hypothetical protein INR49_016307 [Caranx melampygus]
MQKNVWAPHPGCVKAPGSVGGLSTHCSSVVVCWRISTMKCRPPNMEECDRHFQWCWKAVMLKSTEDAGVIKERKKSQCFVEVGRCPLDGAVWLLFGRG